MSGGISAQGITQYLDAQLTEIGNLTPSDSTMVVGDGTGWVAESGATLRTSIGVGTGDSPTFTGQTLSGATASTILATNGSKAVVSLAVATYPSLTELTYVKGVTSAIQTQLGTKVTSGGALGTPTSGVLTNCTGTASGLTAGTVTTNANLTGKITSVGNATSLGSFTSAELKTALSDETGSGAAVFANTPTLVTPVLGVATATSLNFGGGALANYIPSTSFTPGISFGGASVGVTYGTRTGSYTRIGSMVFFNCRIVLTSKGTSTGSVLITGLPVSVAQEAGVHIAYFTGAVGVIPQLIGILNGVTTTFSIYTFTAGAMTALTDAGIANNSTMVFSGMYGV